MNLTEVPEEAARVRGTAASPNAHKSCWEA